MNASQLQSLNDLIRQNVWRLQSVSVNLVDEKGTIKSTDTEIIMTQSSYCEMSLLLQIVRPKSMSVQLGKAEIFFRRNSLDLSFLIKGETC